MILHTQYSQRSAILHQQGQSQIQLAANTLREATYFDGAVRDPLVFRDALAALYDVVVSDLKYRPRDRIEFQAWQAEQDRKFLAQLPLRGLASADRMEHLEARRAELEALRQLRLQPFYRARQRYLEFVYHNEYEQWLWLDPVITVHPDVLSFEAFSRDESTFARLAARRDLFDDVGNYQCGTTNIDFSARLHEQLERMRTYRPARFTVDPGGLTVEAAGDAEVREQKIDLPDSWVNGFLQVHAMMSMGLTRVRLAPLDLFNICRQLRRRRARTSPRALRFELTPGRPARVFLEPWEQEIVLTHDFDGPSETTIRTWGRDRLQVLARLLPACRSVDVYLAGFGLPSFYVLDLGPIVFTLGLSGWTDNDWTGPTSFELLSRRLQLTADQLLRVYEALRERRFASETQLATDTGLGVEQCRSAVSYLCQAGRAMIDLGADVARHRDLFLSPFTRSEAIAVLQRAVEQDNPHAKAAREIVNRDQARFTSRRPVKTGYKLTGSVRGSDDKRVRPLLHVDPEGRILEASCTCRYFHKHKLTKGPCEHILALRLAHMDRLAEEDQS